MRTFTHRRTLHTGSPAVNDADQFLALLSPNVNESQIRD
jgi:hypothetical protein